MDENLRAFFTNLSHQNLVELLIAKYGEVAKLKDEVVELRNILKYYKERVSE